MILSFSNYGKQMKVPFSIYADFECILEDIADITNDNSNNSVYIMQHVPCAYSLNIKCSFYSSLDKFIKYIGNGNGDNVTKHFATTIADISRNIYKDHLQPKVEMSQLTPLEEDQLNNATLCHICG